MPFIVLEGLDGAGKSTQIKKLINALEERGERYEYIHFPRFDAPVYGELVARFLRGEFGSADEVDPYIVALLYAGDRMKAAEQINRWLEEGKYVIIDRYVASNIAYQCAKIDDFARKEELRDWIVNLEYAENGIPKPDVTIFMDVPFSFTERKLTGDRKGDDRTYLNGKQDIHEASLDLQQKVRREYLREAERDDTIAVIKCADEQGDMAAPDEIFSRIYNQVKNFID